MYVSRTSLERLSSLFNGSALRTIKFWVTRNGCRPEPEIRYVADRAPTDGTRIRVEKYIGGEAPVVLAAVEGGGHTWPGGFLGPYALELRGRLGRESRDINSVELLWAFLSKQTRD